MQGWVVLHRKLLDNPISNKADYLSVWIHLLLMANHKETNFIWNNKKQTLKTGQLLTGRKKLSKKTGVAQSQIYKILNYLELEQQIKQQKTTKYTIITIVNWHKYQDKEQQKEQQRDNRVTTTRQQSNTYNNVNNDNNVEQVESSSISLLKDNNLWKELSSKFGVSSNYIKAECEKMEDWLKSKGKRQKDYRAFARNWIRRALENGGEAKVNARVFEEKWKKIKEEERSKYGSEYLVEDSSGKLIPLKDIKSSFS